MFTRLAQQAVFFVALFVFYLLWEHPIPQYNESEYLGIFMTGAILLVPNLVTSIAAVALFFVVVTLKTSFIAVMKWLNDDNYKVWAIIVLVLTLPWYVPLIAYMRALLFEYIASKFSWMTNMPVMDWFWFLLIAMAVNLSLSIFTGKSND